MQVVLLTEGSDLDSLSSAYALSLIEKNTYIYIPHSYSESFKIALQTFKEKLKPKIIKKEHLKEVKKFFVVDTSSLLKINQIISEANLNQNIKITIIDHHEKVQKLPDHLKKIEVNYGACTTYFVKKIKRKKIPLDELDATLISLGIYEDTGCLKYSNTTYHDVDALSFLIKQGINFEIINNILTERFNKKTIKIIEDA
ncbi:MAG: hypothetical protein D6834_00145, partial [Aquificota bacterium]